MAQKSKRVSGALRLVLGLPLYLLSLLVTWPLMVLASLIWVLDSGWQTVTGKEGINADNRVASAYDWYIGLFKYVAFGDSSQGGGKAVDQWTRR